MFGSGTILSFLLLGLVQNIVPGKQERAGTGQPITIPAAPARSREEMANAWLFKMLAARIVHTYAHARIDTLALLHADPGAMPYADWNALYLRTLGEWKEADAALADYTRFMQGMAGTGMALEGKKVSYASASQTAGRRSAGVWRPSFFSAPAFAAEGEIEIPSRINRPPSPKEYQEWLNRLPAADRKAHEESQQRTLMRAYADQMPASEAIRTFLPAYMGEEIKKIHGALFGHHAELSKTYTDEARFHERAVRVLTVIDKGSKVSLFVGGIALSGPLAAASSAVKAGQVLAMAISGVDVSMSVGHGFAAVGLASPQTDKVFTAVEERFSLPITIVNLTDVARASAGLLSRKFWNNVSTATKELQAATTAQRANASTVAKIEKKIESFEAEQRAIAGKLKDASPANTKKVGKLHRQASKIGADLQSAKNDLAGKRTFGDLLGGQVTSLKNRLLGLTTRAGFETGTGVRSLHDLMPASLNKKFGAGLSIEFGRDGRTTIGPHPTGFLAGLSAGAKTLFPRGAYKVGGTRITADGFDYDKTQKILAGLFPRIETDQEIRTRIGQKVTKNVPLNLSDSKQPRTSPGPGQGGAPLTGRWQGNLEMLSPTPCADGYYKGDINFVNRQVYGVTFILAGGRFSSGSDPLPSETRWSRQRTAPMGSWVLNVSGTASQNGAILGSGTVQWTVPQPNLPPIKGTGPLTIKGTCRDVVLDVQLLFAGGALPLRLVQQQSLELSAPEDDCFAGCSKRFNCASLPNVPGPQGIPYRDCALQLQACEKNCKTEAARSLNRGR